MKGATPQMTPELQPEPVDPRVLTATQLAARLPMIELITVIEADARGVFRISPNSMRVKPSQSILWRPRGTDVEIIFPAGEPFHGLRMQLIDGCSGGVEIPATAPEGSVVYEILCLVNRSDAKDHEDNDPEFIIEGLSP